MTEPTQPHDKLFKGLLDQPGTAGALLRERLPPEIASLLADDPPELIDGEFIDEALQGSQSDRLFRARLKDGVGGGHDEHLSGALFASGP